MKKRQSSLYGDFYLAHEVVSYIAELKERIAEQERHDLQLFEDMKSRIAELEAAIKAALYELRKLRWDDDTRVGAAIRALEGDG